MFTGIGGAAGIAVMAASSGLMNMGASMITQKLTTGKVNLTQTLTDGAMGAATGGMNRLKSTLNTTHTILTLTNNTNKITTLTKNTYKITKLETYTSGGGVKNLANNGYTLIKNKLTSKDLWTKLGINTGKDAALGGMSYVVEAGIQGEDVSVGGLFESMAWSVGSGRVSELANTGVRRAVGTLTSKRE